jgi:hypothetical protein
MNCALNHIARNRTMRWLVPSLNQTRRTSAFTWPGMAAVILLSTLSLKAQIGGGTVNFVNSTDTAVTNGQTGNPVTRSEGIRAALYWAPLGSNNFIQIGAAVANVGFPLPGVFAGGTRRTGSETHGGTAARFQVRAWGGGFATYEEALSSDGVLIGQSSIFESPTGDRIGSRPALPPTPPASLLAAGLSGFTVTNHFVPPPPVIVQQPQNRVAAPGSSVQFTVEATGSLPLTYQWQHAGTNLVDRTDSVLDLVNIQVSDFGEYRAVVSNPGGSTNSDPAQLAQPARPQLTAPELNLSTVYLSFPTEIGLVYEVQYKLALDDPAWHLLTTLNGTGGNLSITDNNVTDSTRFYRVRVR